MKENPTFEDVMNASMTIQTAAENAGRLMKSADKNDQIEGRHLLAALCVGQLMMRPIINKVVEDTMNDMGVASPDQIKTTGEFRHTP